MDKHTHTDTYTVFLSMYQPTLQLARQERIVKYIKIGCVAKKKKMSRHFGAVKTKRERKRKTVE